MSNSQRPHKNLEVWKESIQLVRIIYQLCQSLPIDERYGLVSQIKRASVSVASNIAEGAARQSIKEFNQFLSISSGSLSEIDTLLEVLKELNLIDDSLYKNTLNQLNKVTALLNGLKKSIMAKILPSPIT